MNAMDTRIESYRAAAAKLGEALARIEHPVFTVLAAVALLEDDAAAGVQVCADEYDHYYRYHRREGWRWITEAAQLRLLVGAAMLEQAERAESPKRDAWRVNLEYQVELGSLVR